MMNFIATHLWWVLTLGVLTSAVGLVIVELAGRHDDH